MGKVPLSTNRGEESKLKVSELRYRRLFETAQDGIFLIDFDSGMILDVNPFLITMLGYSKADFLKKHLWEVGVFKDIAASKENFETLRTKRYVRFEDLPLVTRSGVKKEVEFVANAYQVDSSIIIQCNIRDITDRKKAENQLIESESRFRNIFENGRYGIILTGANASFIKVNPAFCRMTGYSEKELLTKKFSDITHPDHVKQDVASVQKIINGTLQYYKTEKRYIKKNGEVIWVNLIVSSVKNSDGSFGYFLGMVEDITARKNTEDIIQKNETYQRAILDATTDGILVIDRQGKVILTNSQFMKFWRIPDIVMKTHDDDMLLHYVTSQLVSPQDFFKKVKELYNSTKTDFDTLIFKDGRVFERFSTPLLVKNQIEGRLWSFHDVTQRAKDEREIAEAKAKSEAILTSIGDAVFACDTKGIIVLFNKVAEDLTGVSRNMAIGHHYKEIGSFIREKDQKPVKDFIVDAIKHNAIKIMSNHILYVRCDGKKIPVTDSAAPVLQSDGSVIGCVVVLHDVTKDREIDKAKSELISLASHQLRTPLTTLSWVSELLDSGSDGKLNAKQKQHMFEIHSATKRMIMLVNSLLNVSRLDLGTLSVEPRSIHIKHIVKTCCTELAPQVLEKKLIIRTSYKPVECTILADPKLLYIIIQNLLTNAVKYTPLEGQINVVVEKDTHSFTLSVSDTGIGIPSSQFAHISEKLFRADNAKMIDPNGTGLGLYIVKEIIDQTGGTMQIESQEGKGTVVRVVWPLPGMVKKIGTKKLV